MRLTIVGAGIVGLMAALETRKRGLWTDVCVVDAGPDPRSIPFNTTSAGATYSGLDARHVSLTETGPWTSAGREKLIRRPAQDGGWCCISQTDLNDDENAWLDEFQRISRDPDVHVRNSAVVFEINRAGMQGWKELAFDGLVPMAAPPDTMTIVCREDGDLISEHAGEVALDPHIVSEPTPTLPADVAQLRDSVGGVVAGSFVVTGNAYYAKTLCCQLLSRLESDGVTFLWNTRIPSVAEAARYGRNSNVADGVIWAAGVSVGGGRELLAHGLMLQGVAGAWTTIENPGFLRPFKVLGAEPTNFINCTPQGESLVLSGGYGFVGQRPLSEARRLAQPILGAFLREVAWWFFNGNEARLQDAPTAMCIRPSLPNGIPEVKLVNNGPVACIVCVGHCAGGFTQSPAVARQAVNALAGGR
jgi:glycine/D-amino acid oxidase-like deaminating enzyme